MKMLKGNLAQTTEGMADSAIAILLDQLQKGELKASAADLVRLLQFRSEPTSSTPRPVAVKWIDECQKPASEE